MSDREKLHKRLLMVELLARELVHNCTRKPHPEEWGPIGARISSGDGLIYQVLRRARHDPRFLAEGWGPEVDSYEWLMAEKWFSGGERAWKGGGFVSRIFKSPEAGCAYLARTRAQFDGSDPKVMPTLDSMDNPKWERYAHQWNNPKLLP